MSETTIPCVYAMANLGMTDNSQMGLGLSVNLHSSLTREKCHLALPSSER